MFAPAIGPAISGMLIQYLSWRFIFWLSLPLLGLGMFLGLKYLENVTEVKKPSIDGLSVVLSTIGFGGIVFGFGQAGKSEGGWTNPVVLAAIIIGVMALILFVLRQNREEPLLNLHVFKYPMYVLGVALVMMCMVITMSTMIVLPMFLQTGAGLTVFVTGLMLLPGSALNGILQPIIGRLFDKYGPKWLVLPGLVMVILMLWFFTTLTPASSVGLIVVLHMGLMAGVAFIWPASQTNGLNQLPPELYPHGTAVMNTLQQVIGAIGTAVAVTILAGGMDTYLATSNAPTKPTEIANAITAGAQSVFIVILVIAIAGLMAGLFIRRSVINHGGTKSSH